jgi:hypothetical protein
MKGLKLNACLISKLLETGNRKPEHSQQFSLMSQKVMGQEPKKTAKQNSRAYRFPDIFTSDLATFGKVGNPLDLLRF